MKTVLVIATSSPYSGIQLKETLDLCLSFAAFDQEVSFALESKASISLLKSQVPLQTDLIKQKSLEKLISVLPMYGVEQVYAENINFDPCIPVTIEKFDSDFFSRFDHVVRI